MIVNCFLYYKSRPWWQAYAHPSQMFASPGSLGGMMRGVLFTAAAGWDARAEGVDDAGLMDSASWTCG
jgi:hypothetical protein